MPTFLYGQNRNCFKIIGNSIFYNNQNLAVQVGVFSTTDNYNDFKFENDKVDTVSPSFKFVKLQKYQFTIDGFLKYPHPVFISYYDAETNSVHSAFPFFIDAGVTNININDLFANKNLSPRLISKSNVEYQLLKKLYSNSVDTLTLIINNIRAKQKTLNKYLLKHQDSYVALWDMVIDYAIYKIYKNNDDKKILLKNAQLLSPTIKKTNTYKALIKNINQDFELLDGKLFPDINLNSTNQDLQIVENRAFPNMSLNLIDSLSSVTKKNKFTLIDFWFSYCKPCLAEFPQYKEIYDLYKTKGFEIIGISVDRKEDELNWQNTIKKYNLNWLQYLDKNEIVTNKLNIKSFPTNFLLDNNGVIIKKDISPEELKAFLQNSSN